MKKRAKIIAPTLALGMVVGASGVSADSVTETINSGETLWGISQDYENVSVQDIKELNPNVDPYSLTVGQEITIKANDQSDNSSREVFHTVEPGETIQSIANLHKDLTVDELYELNPSLSPDSLEVGSEVRVSDYNYDLFHTIQSGDTLYGIAQTYDGVTLDDLYELNRGIDPYKLMIGSEIRIRS